MNSLRSAALRSVRTSRINLSSVGSSLSSSSSHICSSSCGCNNYTTPLFMPTTAPASPGLGSVRNMSAGSAQHVMESYNRPETHFDFTEENYEKVERILGKYPDNYRQSGIIPMLDLAQRQNGGWTSLAAMDKIAKIVNVHPMRVYEVATFYTMFNREKVGKYVASERAVRTKNEERTTD